jgi:ubiquinone/menaquinone biosynthesis C-methylase UbiE
MHKDPKHIVQSGYDANAARYAEWAAGIIDQQREQSVEFLLNTLPERATLLDIGCGHGLPSTLALAQRFCVTGVDISVRQIEAARRNVPGATFIQSDVMDLDVPDESFDAITAFYSIIHLPRDEQPELFRRMTCWLKPGGWLIAVLGTRDASGDVDPDWLGAPMYWSHFPSDVNLTMAVEAGLTVVSSEEHTILEEGVPVTFHWLVCRRP